jgi:hypothetical protein
MFAVEFLAEGLTFDLKHVLLVDTAGNRVMPSSGENCKQDHRQDVSLTFNCAAISRDPSKCHLAFEVPDTGEKTIGPLGDLAAKSVRAGATIFRITRAEIVPRAGGEDFEVRMEFDGFPATLQQVALVGEGTEALKPRGWGGGGNLTQFWFNPTQIRGKAESYRLRLEAPTKVTEHVLQATFRDVPLAK